jgi:hypothetical protein
MNDQDLTKTDYDPDRSLVLIEGLSHFLTNFVQNLASCQTSLNLTSLFALFVFLLGMQTGEWCVHNRFFNANFEDKVK